MVIQDPFQEHQDEIRCICERIEEYPELSYMNVSDTCWGVDLEQELQEMAANLFAKEGLWQEARKMEDPPCRPPSHETKPQRMLKRHTTPTSQGRMSTPPRAKKAMQVCQRLMALVENMMRPHVSASIQTANAQVPNGDAGTVVNFMRNAWTSYQAYDGEN